MAEVTAEQLFEVDVFGGRRTFGERSECPPGMSPNCSDVVFGPDSVRSRPGLRLRYTGFKSGINSIYSFYAQDRLRRLALFKNNGNLLMEGPRYVTSGVPPTSTQEGVSVPIRAGIAPNAMMKAVHAFGRLWMTFSDGKRPLDYPYQYDPGYSTSDWPHGALLPATPCEPTVEALTANAVAGGTMVAGIHYYFVTYEDKYGYITGASPVGLISVAGGQKVTFTNVAQGPVLGTTSQRVGATARRRFWFTAAEVAGVGSGHFFSLASFSIDNAGTGPYTIDFKDSDLITNGIDYSPSLTRVPMPPAIGVGLSENRLMCWGVYGALPTTIDSIITPAGGTGGANGHIGIPSYDFGTLGVPNPSSAPALDATWYRSAAGAQTVVIVQGETDAGGTRNLACVRLSGDGATGTAVALNTNWPIYLAADQNEPIFFAKPGTRIGFVMRIRRGPAATTETLTARIQTAAAIDVSLLQVALSTIPTDWTIVDVPALVDIPTNITPGSKLILMIQVSKVGGPGNGALLDVDWVRPYPAVQKFDGSRVWFSEFGQPEQFDLVKSPLEVNIDDGEEIRYAWNQNGNTYIAKERSLWSTSDSAQDPADWPILNVSTVVGTPSINGVGLGPDFAIIASQDGAYFFDSGKLEKVSQEIQDDWNAVDWTQGHLIWVVVDPRLKQVRIGVPRSTATGVCSQIFYCDYAEGWSEGTTNGGHGRKWSIDTVQTSCAEYALKDDLTQRITYGGRRTSYNNGGLDFTGWTQTGSVSPAITGSRMSPFGDLTAVEWAYGGAGTYRANFVPGGDSSAGQYLVVSFWVKNPASGSGNAGGGIIRVVPGSWDGPTSIPFSFETDADGNPLTANQWQRVVARFGPCTAGPNPDILDVEFTGMSAPPTVTLYGPQFQRGFDTGYVTNGGPREAGFVSEPGIGLAGVPGWSTADWDGIVAPVYEIAPLRLPLLRLRADRMVARIRGAGNLFASWVFGDGSTTGLDGGAGTPLGANPTNDAEKGGTTEGTFVGLRLFMSDFGSWLSLTKLGIFLREHPSNKLRGKG
jgi:hypothetical protein